MGVSAEGDSESAHAASETMTMDGVSASRRISGGGACSALSSLPSPSMSAALIALPPLPCRCTLGELEAVTSWNRSQPWPATRSRYLPCPPALKCDVVPAPAPAPLLLPDRTGAPRRLLAAALAVPVGAALPPGVAGEPEGIEVAGEGAYGGAAASSSGPRVVTSRSSAPPPPPTSAPTSSSACPLTRFILG